MDAELCRMLGRVFNSPYFRVSAGQGEAPHLKGADPGLAD
jgi:hypothetical protein